MRFFAVSIILFPLFIHNSVVALLFRFLFIFFADFDEDENMEFTIEGDVEVSKR